MHNVKENFHTDKLTWLKGLHIVTGNVVDRGWVSSSLARSVRQVMDRVFFLPFMAQARSV